MQTELEANLQDRAPEWGFIITVVLTRMVRQRLQPFLFHLVGLQAGGNQRTFTGLVGPDKNLTAYWKPVLLLKRWAQRVIFGHDTQLLPSTCSLLHHLS